MRALVLLCIGLGTSTAHGADIYVDGRSGDDNATGTRASPVRTTWHAIDLAVPGDVVHLLPTTVYLPFGVLTKSGTPTAWITITGDGVAPHLTRVRARRAGFGFQINAGVSYIAVTNLDIAARGGWSTVYVGDNSHHITIEGNLLHDGGLSGISTTHADYLTIRHNTVYHNAGYTRGGAFGSGISLYENRDIDASTAVKSVIDGNIVYANTNTPTARFNGGADADGSGIIVDDNRHAQTDNVAYHGATLIENNIVFGNGGRGIYTYLSDHVVATNNTVFHNNLDPHEASWHPGEIMVERGGDIGIYENILDGDGATGSGLTGAHTALSVEDCTDGAGAINVNSNLLFQTTPGMLTFFGETSHQNTNAVVYGPRNQQADPLFVAPVLDPKGADFHLQRTSPALGVGDKSLAAATDITGTPRPNLIDLGVYQQTQ